MVFGRFLHQGGWKKIPQTLKIYYDHARNLEFSIKVEQNIKFQDFTYIFYMIKVRSTETL